MVSQISSSATANATAHYGMRPITVRSDGRIYTAWQTPTGSVISSSDDRGDTWTTPEPIGLAYPETVREVSLAANGIGTVYAIYAGGKTNPDYQSIVLRTIDSDDAWSAETEICYVSGYDQCNPSIAVYSDGSYVMAAWGSFGLQDSNKDVQNIGQTFYNVDYWMGPGYLTLSAYPQLNPCAMVHDGVGFYLGWWSTYTEDTSQWYGITNQNSPPPYTWLGNRSEGTFSANGDFAFDGLLMHKAYANENGVYYSRRWPDANDHSTPEVVALGSTITDMALTVVPSSVTGAAGNPCVAWVDAGTLKFSRRVGTTWTAPFTVDDTLTNITYPRFADRYPYLIYQGSDGSIRFADLAIPNQTVEQVGATIRVLFSDG